MGITETTGSRRAPGEPFVIVTVTSIRGDWEALLEQEGLIPQSYTPLGIVWSTLMQSIRDALDKE